MADPLMIKDLENATTTVRTANNNGYPGSDSTWDFYFAVYPANDGLGTIHLDNNAEWWEDSGITHDPARHLVLELDSHIDFPLDWSAGETITITYDSGQTLKIYLPAGEDAGYVAPDWNRLYVATSGSTYYNQALTNLAYAAPTFPTDLDITGAVRGLGILTITGAASWSTSGDLTLTGNAIQSPPQIPTGLTAIDMEKADMVRLSWTANAETNVIKYNIYYSTVLGGPYTLKGYTSGTTFDVGGLDKGTTYYFVITAVVIVEIE